MNTATRFITMILAVTGFVYAADALGQTPERQLQHVTVTSRKPLIKQEAERIVYDLQADPDSKSSSLMDMMRKMPYLSTDAEDNLLLKGNTGFKILINGKPSAMLEKNMKEVLRSIPAATIQRIEVITIPPSRYDSEGFGGIINIITTKRIGDGYNGTLNAVEKFPTGGPGVGGSLNIREGKLGISAFGGASNNHAPLSSSAVSRQTYGQEPSRLLQQGARFSDGSNSYGGAELSLEMDSLHLLSGQVNYSGGNDKGNSTRASQLHTAAGELQQQYYLQNNTSSRWNSLDAGLNYQLGFAADKNRLLTFSYRYAVYGNSANNNIGITKAVNYATPDYLQKNEERAREHTVQVDYVRPLGKITMEAGVKGIFRNNKSDFAYLSYNSISGKFEPDADRTNNFIYHQQVISVYNSYQFAFGQWSGKAGVRLEKTITDADFISTASQAQQNYLNLVPAVAINKKLTTSTSLNLGWTQRVRRPGINKLNPFVDRSNPNVESSGNPYLQPALINDIQLSYNQSKKLSLTIGAGYAFASRFDLRVTQFDSVANITRTTFENMGRARRMAIDFSAAYPVTSRWNCSTNGSLEWIRMEGLADGAWSKRSWLLYAVTTNSSYRFDKGWRVNAGITVRSGGPSSLQGWSNGLVRSSLGVTKTLLKDKLTASATVSNPFGKYRNNILETGSVAFTETAVTEEYYRSFNISVNYNFGKLKTAIRKNKRSIRNDDGAGY